jgi:ligand-binding sensor domain-containing protein
MKKLVLVLLLWLPAVSGFCQNESFVFSNLNETDGLSDNVVNCLIRDQKGFFWIGTYNGISRFDGANFYSYKIRKGPNSMLNEVVHSLCEDQQGRIWGATNGGVFAYNQATDSFQNFVCKSMDRMTGFTNICCDRNGDVWATGNWTLFKYNAAKKIFEAKLNTTNAKDSLGFYGITKNGLLLDPATGYFWITTSSGLMCYDATQDRVFNAQTEPNTALFARHYVAGIHRSASGHYWYYDGESHAVIQFDPNTRQTIRRIDLHTALPNGSVATIFEDKNERLWLSSWNYKMLVVDLAHQETIQHLYHQTDDRSSIAGDFFWSVYQDANNTLWLGTVAGISRCNPERNIYKEYRLGNSIAALKSVAIHLAAEDPADKSMWLVNREGMLIHYDPKTGVSDSTNINAAPKQANGNVPGFVSAIKFLNNQVMVTTANGSWQTGRQKIKLVPFSILPGGYEHFLCKEIVPLGDSLIYYNSGKQILKWNRLNNTTQLMLMDTTILKRSAYGLHVTPQRRVWVITDFNSIAEVLPDGKLLPIEVTSDHRKQNGTILSLKSDQEYLWILNKGVGLYRYHLNTRRMEFWDETDGLAGNRLHNMVPDPSGKLWTMLYDKVSVYIPATNKFYNFKIPYSESNLNYYNHLSKLSNGHILGTVYNELVEFFPERLLATPVAQQPLISEFSVAGINYPIASNQPIRLQPDQNTVRIRFGSTISKEIFPYDLEYKLGGDENNWAPAGEKAEALYNNLPAGDYTFRVRIKGKNNAWQSDEAVLHFIIQTPFYQSAWFFATLFLIGASIWYLIYRYRTRQKEKLILLESKTQLLEKEKALVMYENLKQHLNPHFLFNSLTSLSSLIRIDPQQASDFLEKMSKVYRYILKNRDNEVVPISDELKFVQLYIDLQKTRFEDGLQVRININEQYHYRKIAPVTLQNLVENAIKHNTADAESPLLIELLIEDEYLIVRNNLQKKNFVETSNRQGLQNMESLYRYLSKKPMEIIETPTQFIVKIPLL